ncbi:MAG TPA: TetR/AcrR family transcriptional regulator [Trebonia sp.]
MAPTQDDVASQPLDARVIRTRNDILRAAVDVLTGEGLDAVTHHRLAEVAGYSRATIYKHWPTRDALFLEAFSNRPSGAHSVPAGDLRADLISELTMFRLGMERHRLDRALAALASLSTSVPGLAEVRDRLIAEGERVLLELLTPVARGAQLEAAMRMLSGSVLQSALLHGYLPSDEVIAATVDLLLHGLNPRPAAGLPPHFPQRARGARSQLLAHDLPDIGPAGPPPGNDHQQQAGQGQPGAVDGGVHGHLGGPEFRRETGHRVDRGHDRLGKTEQAARCAQVRRRPLAGRQPAQVAEVQQRGDSDRGRGERQPQGARADDQ